MSLKFPIPQDILSHARLILESEKEAIDQVSKTLTEDFCYAVQLILGSCPPGHVITCGMGKAGIIANKISATFSSLGFPSFFLHPAEAIHGDLGRFTKNDVALILSNSGESVEVSRILPSLKTIGCPIIAMTGNKDSSLARHSDITLCFGNLKEAEPLGLAPTASTTAMLALGDALAMCLIKIRGFSKEDFAFFHPGGKLGKSLLKVSEVMRTGDSICIVNETTLVKEVLEKISKTKGRPGAACIIGKDNKLSGIFTDGDLRRHLAKGTEFLLEPVKIHMGVNPKVVSPDVFASNALSIMAENKIDQIIIVDDGNSVLGMIDVQDLV